MNGLRRGGLRRRCERLQRSAVASEVHAAAVTLEVIEDNERLRAAIRAHRATYCDPEMASPNELRAANRQLWATVEEKS